MSTANNINDLEHDNSIAKAVQTVESKAAELNHLNEVIKEKLLTLGHIHVFLTNSMFPSMCYA